MEEKLFEKLDDLNIRETELLLDKDINLSLDDLTIKRIEKSIKRKTGYYSENNVFKQKINNILGGFIMKRKIALALAVVAVSSLGGGVYAHAKTTPVAYVSLDINPSVELGVNTFNEVVSAEAYNEDGEKVLEGTNLISTDIDVAVSTVVSNAISDGYIKEDDTAAIDTLADTTTSAAVEITISTDKDNVAAELEEALKDAVDKTLEENDADATVETDNVALARRDEARELGITPGKLNLIQKLQALDPNIKVEEYKDSSVKDIQKKAKELRKENKSDEVTTEENTNTDVNAETNTSKDVVTQDKTNNSSKANENANKEEKKNTEVKKAETKTTNAKDNVDKSEKQNGNDNANAQNKENNKDKK
ncbi:hypothetical protein D2A34_08685 [Clostridium chromiireducens]|uniref:Anti-sigma factor RsgI-like middle domain-containing protein n=1 Tax=Clostridium chromiireducens TaxID=225345 RepID=A0A399IQF2_9CLOT|nr:hypothetical protein [Clostridium chromiireducens]RII35273.1 hypothetical protein D2A34_08685 [Clostridium chromiireducens]